MLEHGNSRLITRQGYDYEGVGVFWKDERLHVGGLEMKGDRQWMKGRGSG